MIRSHLRDGRIVRIDDDKPEEGEPCRVMFCGGKLEYIRESPCRCHINPPCSSCTDAPLTCNKCGEYADVTL